jgi:hypothetical protein
MHATLLSLIVAVVVADVHLSASKYGWSSASLTLSRLGGSNTSSLCFAQQQ